MALIIFLFVLAASFAAAGIAYALRRAPDETLESYTTARGTLGATTATLTFFASGMGGWILFGPAEAATWGGLPAMIGYAAGSALPLLILIRLAGRLRRLVPNGHTLTEFVYHRYGRGMHAFCLAIMLFYLFIFLTAEVTGLALMMQLTSGVAPWITALVVLVATLAYTALGGLRASVFTDRLQSIVMLPLFVLVVAASLALLGGVGEIVGGASERAPELLDLGFGAGLESAATLLIGIAAANLFDQGYWQRVYAARDLRALRRGFLAAAALIVPVVFMMGFFGLAAVAFDRAETPSIALFAVLLDAAPAWLVWSLTALGLLLVMSSADTLLNAAASLIAVDARRVWPDVRARSLLAVSRWATVLLAVPVWAIAARGYSVLYLFLVADLVCAAAAFPVFFGLYNRRFDGRAAVQSAAAGLLCGALLLPDPTFTVSPGGWIVGLLGLGGLLPAGGNLLAAFALALLVPALVGLLARSRSDFDFESLDRLIRPIQD